MVNLKLVFRSLEGRCHDNQFLSSESRLVAQPGGLTLGFVSGVCNVSCLNYSGEQCLGKVSLKVLSFCRDS